MGLQNTCGRRSDQKQKIYNGLLNGRVTCSIRSYPLDCAKKNDGNENAVSPKVIQSNQKILSMSNTLNNEDAKVKVENSVNLILDYRLNPLY